MREKEIKIGDKVISQNTFTMIAGPCALESKEQMEYIINNVTCDFYRAGAYKPRTSPDSFQGLKRKGTEILNNLKNEYSIGIVSEVMSIDQLENFTNIDIIQIGARNMQNFDLLTAVAKLQKPILLKRGMGNTVEELIAASKYIEKEGNDQIIFCERGIRTFETSTRFMLDIAAISILQQETPYPVIVDPSHAAGRADLVEPLSLAAVAAGCNGLLIEVHPNPREALSDAEQQLTVEEFRKIQGKIEQWKKLS